MQSSANLLWLAVAKNDNFLVAKADLVAVKLPPVFTKAAKVSLSPILIESPFTATNIDLQL